MTITDKPDLLKDKIHQMVDALPETSLKELVSFIDYLWFKEQSGQPGSPWAKELYALFASARDAQTEMTEEEINQLIAEELEAVRRESDD